MLRVCALLFVGLILSAAARCDSPATQWTPEMFGALPTYLDIRIAPDGRRLAMLRTAGDDVEVVVRDLQTGSARGTRIERAMARNLDWAGNDMLLLRVSQTLERRTTRGLRPLYASRWLAVSADTLKSRVLFGDEPGYYIQSAGALLGAPAGDEPRALFARWTMRRTLPAEQSFGSRLSTTGKEGALGLFSVDLLSGKSQVLANGSPATIGWQVSAAGEAAIRIDSVAVTSEQTAAGSNLHLRANSQAPATTHLVAENNGDLSAISFVGLTAGGSQPLVSGLRAGTRGVWRYDLKTSQIGEPLFWSEKYDVGELVHDHHAAGLSAVHYVDDLPRMQHFNPAAQRMQDQLSAAMPEAAPLLWSQSSNGKRSIVKTHYKDHPEQWFLYEPQEKRLDMIAASHESLDGKQLPAKSAFDYTSSDGLKIPGYLTVAADSGAAALPLVVLVHGGPQARDDQAFDYWSAFYAARGYLVYQPNFRGSDGYGVSFRAAGRGEWGRAMQQDVDEGVRKLIADGRALAGRVCIVGASFGGYAALVGATMSDGLYACAVSVNGFANVGDMYDFLDQSGDAFWEHQIGKRSDRAKLRQISPLHQAANASAPVLLIHGKDDTVVPVGQSKAMAKALTENRKSVKFIELKGEDHWLSTASTRIEMLRRSIDFIDTHLAEVSVPAGASKAP